MPDEYRPGHAALRRGRIPLPNHLYLLTFITDGRRPIFTDTACAMAAARAINDARLWPDARLLAWVLMPDHWHGLVQLGGTGGLAPLVQRLKANSARPLPAGVARPVWGRGFHDHALRQEEDVRAVARYIVMNPVRAGIATSPRFYAYWNAVWL